MKTLERALIVLASSLWISAPARADDSFSELGNFSGFFGFYEIVSGNQQQECPAGVVIWPDLPPSFDCDEIAFTLDASNFVSITPFTSIAPPQTPVSAIVELQNGNYGIMQDLLIQVPATETQPRDFANIVLRFDLTSQTVGGRFLTQIIPSDDPELDFVRIIGGHPNFPGQPLGLKVGLVQTTGAGIADDPLRAWSLAPVGILAPGETAEVRISFDLGVPVECTPAGSNVEVELLDTTTGTSPVTATFDEVVTAGHTHLETASQGPPPPTGFKLGAPPTYYEITTTATFTGEVELCIDYSTIGFGNENNLKLFHTSDGGVTWTDITTSLDTVADIICGVTTSFSTFAVLEVIPDSDGDGLDDEQEIIFGTNPAIPDTDGDGLMDGTEVDIAEGSGCPNPTLADSDGDGVSDGSEVDAGIDPCNPDTDADGIPDGIDPLPADPEGTPEFLEQELRDLSDFVSTVDLADIDAKNSNAAKGRRNAMSNKLNAAANAAAAGDYQAALDQLFGLLEKLDGELQPPDWMLPSSSHTVIVVIIVDTIQVLEYL